MTMRAILISSLFLGSTAVAQPLSVAVEEGLRTNPGLAAETARVEAAAEAIAAARAAGRPNVQLSGQSSYGTGTFDPGPDAEMALGQFFGPGGDGEMGPDIGELLGTDGGRVTSRAELAVTQPVFTGFRILNGIREAEAAVAGARARLEGARQGYAFRIVDAYLTVVSAEAEIRAVSKSTESLTQAARAAQISFEAGQATRTDVAIAQSRLSAVQAQLAAAQARAIAARQNFAVLGGETIVQFDLPAMPLNVPVTADDALGLAMANHPELQAVLSERNSAAAAVKGAKAGRSPQVQLRGSLSYADGQFFDDDRSENATIAAQVSVPLFEGGAIRSRVRAAEADARAARFAQSDAQRRVAAEVRSAWASHRAAEQSAVAAAARLEAAELAWRGVQLEREVGQRSVLDVLRVEEDLLAAQVADINAKAGVVRASWRLALATGTIS
ncbi:MAG: TolC family protein [Pseudomonadota bacterium]